MSIRHLIRWPFRRRAARLGLLGGLVLLVGIGAVTVVSLGGIEGLRGLAGLGDQVGAEPTIHPLPTTGPVVPAAVEMPLQGDCLACHQTTTGIGLVPVPALGHPLAGWRDCTACHAPERLVQTAPGHTSLHRDQCLLCHTHATPAAPSRPHSSAVTTDCLACHGTSAPLPGTMVGRDDATCWLCHRASPATGSTTSKGPRE